MRSVPRGAGQAGPAQAADPRRAGRNLTTLGPMMGGAIAGSVVNHRETRRVGEGVRDDLRRRPPRTVPGEAVTG